MNNQEILEKIKSKGYWQINIRPLVYEKQLIESRTNVKEILKGSIVELRGWDYPHFRDSDGEPYPIENGVEKSIDWLNHIELWRMTQSGNFLHFLALREDWTNVTEYHNIWSRGDELKNKSLLGILSTLYTFVEIYEFTKRLAKHSIFDAKVHVDIKLYGIFERLLFVDDSRRLPFSFPRTAKISGPWSWEKDHDILEILNDTPGLSLKAYLDLVELFGWENPPVDALKNDIQKFLEGKI